MSDDDQRIEVITGTARRRRWSIEEELRIAEERLLPGERISAFERRNDVEANLLYRWRRLMTEGGAIAGRVNDGDKANSKLNERISWLTKRGPRRPPHHVVRRYTSFHYRDRPPEALWCLQEIPRYAAVAA